MTKKKENSSLKLIWTVVPILISFGSLFFSIKAYNLSKQIAEDKSRPFFEFDIIKEDSLEFLKIRPFANDIKIQKANYIISSSIDQGWTNLQVEQPDFLLFLGDFYDFINKQESAKQMKSEYKDSISVNSDTIRIYNTTFYNIAREIPFGLTIEYVQFGKVKSINALYALQYKSSYKRENKFEITGVVFRKYFDATEELKSKILFSSSNEDKAK